ncbi:MAG: quinone-dependent dihydroorotate dehydrogenase [Pseudomonadota bacterium]
MRDAIALSVLHKLDPERAHDLTLHAIRLGLGPRIGPVTSPRLATDFAGMALPNPVGLAAGLDKNARALLGLCRAGFGFLEAGAATPKPQRGNPKPRLFRLRQDHAAINRFGFNNDGMVAIGERLARTSSTVPVGLNLGANKDAPDRAADFAQVLRHCGPYIDFATVNVSSPNTENLRDLQGPAALNGLLRNVLAVRDDLPRKIPIFVKIAPDLSPEDLAEIAETAVAVGLDGIVATNTTTSRDGLKSAHAGEAGGLSGQPLFERATRVLAQLAELTDGQMPIIGVGGIASAEQAYAKIKAGAHAIQLYTGLVFHGLSLVAEIAHGLDRLLERDGFKTVADAVGTDRAAWL